MDNVCHTLVGAALGEAGLKRRTRHGQAALMIAANLPDIDVLVFFTSTPAVSFRRGWTHGVLAQILLPLALAGVFWALDRLRRRRAHAPAAAIDGARDEPPLHLPWLIALAYAGLFSHVFLDYLNNYGIRLLAPFDWRWFYGDAVFIVDPWLWLVLGAGVWLARRRQRAAPAAGALAFAAAYIALMLLSARDARASVQQAWRETRGSPPHALMVGPVPVVPFERQVIVDAGTHYERGRFSWRSGAVTFDPETVPKNDDAPGIAEARRARNVAGFLVWSRFPYWEIEDAPGGRRVTVKDMRFGDRFGASVVVEE